MDRIGDEKKYKQYCAEFSKFINISIQNNKDIHFVFVAHIPSDLIATSDILENVYDYNCRNNITVAPYLNGTITPSDYIADLYRKSDLVIGMIYHFNICSIVMNTPMIGIVTLNKHIELYKNIGMSNRLFNVNQTSFSEQLYDQMINVLDDKSYFIEQNNKLLTKLENDSSLYYAKIKELLT